MSTATGCASIFHGTTERLSIRTSVPDAQIFLDERYVGQGSVTMEVDSTKGHSIHARASGYQDAWAGAGLDPAIGYYVVDAIFTLGVGILIDAATGAITTFEHNDIALTLAPRGAEADGSGQLLQAPPLSSPSDEAAAESRAAAIRQAQTRQSQPAPRLRPSTPAAPPPTVAAPAGCQYDTQCKGDRICKDGACVEPLAATQVETPPTNATAQ